MFDEYEVQNDSNDREIDMHRVYDELSDEDLLLSDFDYDNGGL